MLFLSGLEVLAKLGHLNLRRLAGLDRLGHPWPHNQAGNGNSYSRGSSSGTLSVDLLNTKHIIQSASLVGRQQGEAYRLTRRGLWGVAGRTETTVDARRFWRVGLALSICLGANRLLPRPNPPGGFLDRAKTREEKKLQCLLKLHL